MAGGPWTCGGDHHRDQQMSKVWWARPRAGLGGLSDDRSALGCAQRLPVTSEDWCFETWLARPKE